MSAGIICQIDKSGNVHIPKTVCSQIGVSYDTQLVLDIKERRIYLSVLGYGMPPVMMMTQSVMARDGGTDDES